MRMAVKNQYLKNIMKSTSIMKTTFNNSVVLMCFLVPKGLCHERGQIIFCEMNVARYIGGT